MKIGQTRKVDCNGGFAILKKVKTGVYFIQDARTLRARWGNKKQIEKDARHYTETGVLPREKESVH